jgi:copper(I)-binding protein
VLCSSAALAHVTLPAGGASAGSEYDAAFRVGHACTDAKATTGMRVRLPAGFTLIQAQARPGWTLAATPTEVAWTADSAQAALPAAERAEFIVRGKLTDKPGPLYFQVLQRCDVGSADWAQLPAAGSTDKLALPAARLDVLPAGVAAVEVRDAWVRQTVPGQSGTGAFMKLSAPSGARLVGASTPAAGVAEVHEMKLDGDTMKMREVAAGVVLPPRQTVELKPSGLHLMLMDLKQPLPKGGSIPLTLRFEDAKGAPSTLKLELPIGTPADQAQSGHAHGHDHGAR